MAQLVKNLPAMWETWVWSLGWEDPLEKGKATHSNILAWRIPWTIVHGVAKSQTQWNEVGSILFSLKGLIEACCAVLCLVTQSCPTLCNSVDFSLPGLPVHGHSLGKNTWVGCRALLQGIFPTQGSNPRLLHYKQILCHLSYREELLQRVSVF